MHPELIEYIKGQRAAGIPDNVIAEATIASGWAKDEVQAIFTSLGVVTIVTPPTTPAATPAEIPVTVTKTAAKTPEKIAEAPAKPVTSTKQPSKAGRNLLIILLYILGLFLALGLGYLIGQTDRSGEAASVVTSPTPTATATPLPTITASPSSTP